jgi:hypothetical protein
VQGGVEQLAAPSGGREAGGGRGHSGVTLTS